jgi:hypothetical protein
MELISPLRLKSCSILAKKCSGESIPWAISLIPTLLPVAVLWAIKNTALIAYSHVFENIAII